MGIHPDIFIDENAWLLEWSNRWDRLSQIKRCTRCIYGTDLPKITFNSEGVCNFCEMHDKLSADYPAGDAGWSKMQEVVAEIKNENRKKQFDVIVGVSGGCDSSYLLHLAKELGLRPLAVHYDNTWNSTIAVENIKAILKILDVELWTYVVDNEEYDDLYRSYLQAGTPDLESPTDIGLATVLNRAADKFKTRYIFEGHSFRTEGISPLGWLYMDARYIQSVQKQFGTRKLKTFPNLWFTSQLKWMLVNRLKKIRPLWYINHNKEETKKLLSDKYGWKWYGGHHLENRMTAFFHTYFFPRRWEIDARILGFAALVRSGQMGREEGLKLLGRPPECDLEIVELVKKRLGYDNDDFIKLMCLPKKSYKEYKTYKPLFEKLRGFFYLMAKMDLIPMSFYMKYTSKD